MAAESTTHIFTSLYNFTEVAKFEIVENFKESNVEIDVQLEPTHNDLFILRCPKDDKTSPVSFVNLLSRYISSESEKELETFENVKVKRSADTQTEADAATEEQFPAEDAQQEDSELIDDTDIVEIPLIPHETFSRTWSTKIANPHTKAGLTFNKRFLEMIGNLTGCRVELEPDGNTVTAKGENHEQINRAMSKLDSVDRWAHEKKSFCPRSYDFQYSEGEFDIMLQLRTLKELKDRRLNTTLVPPDFPNVKTLSSHLTTIMVKQGVEVTVNQSGRPTKQCLLWKDHVFKFREDESTNPSKEDFTPPSSSVSSAPLGNASVPAKVATVDQWVKESASEEKLEDPFSPPSITKEDRDSIPEVIVPPPVERPAPPARKRFAKSRKPMGVEVRVQVPVKDDSAESTAANPPVIPANAENDTVNHEFLGSECSDDAKIHLKDAGTRLPSNNQPLDAPPIKPPFMPTETNPSTKSEYGGSDSSWEKQVVNTGRAGRLIDDSLPRSNIRERIQATDEVQTRQIRRTMNQRKSAYSAGNSKGSFVALLRDFELATTTILEIAQYSQGPIKLRVEIGRILIDNMSGSSEFKKKPFSIGDWPRVFPIKAGGIKLVSLFTNLLTTSPADAQFVLSLKHSTGRRMFTELPAERKVTYRFKCITATDDEVFVEVDERGGYEILCKEDLIGALNWHFPRRFWDARLTVTSSEQVSSDIRKSVKEMVNSLCIRPSQDQKNFDLSTKIETGDLRIQSIILHRETRHAVSDYADILLHLLEVQELNLFHQEGKVEYQASLPPVPNTSSPGCGSWWEVSLSSVLATDAFKQNQVLELGDSASWTPEEVIGKNSVKDLSYVARDLVERIDAVGSLNKGPKGGSGTKSSDQGKSTEVYW